ncbi:hypothetical protein Tco_0701090 [Tanacetum coccineum]
MAGEDKFNNDNPPLPPPPVTPTQQAPHTLSTIKLPILKKCEYDIWAMKMEHYLGHTNYPIWDVIQKGNGSVQVSTDTNGQIRVLPPKTAEEILARERERKARTTLLMAIPEDHLAKFHKMTDAKEMWEEIKFRFEGLHKGYDRFQSLLSQLEIHGAGVSTEDANQKFLRVFKYDIKGSTASSSSTQNVAFVSFESTNSTNDVSTAYGVSTYFGHNSQKEGSSSYTDELKDGFEMASSHDFHEIEEVLQEDREKGTLLESADQKEIKKAEGEMQGTLGVDWTGHAEDEQENFALMAYNNSGSDTKVTSCSKECVESYAKLKKINDEQKEQLGDAKIRKFSLYQAKKVEAQLVAHQKNQLWYEENIRFMKIDLDDITDVLTYHKKLLAKAVKEKVELKTKLENFQSSSKGLSKLLNKVLESVFDSRSSNVEDSPVYDRFAKVEGMHAVPPPMIGNYMPPKSDFGIDESNFTYGPKQAKTSESDAKTSDFDSCETNSSVETLKSVPEPVVVEPKVDKYVAETLKRFDFASVKTSSTPIETQKPLTKDEEAADVDVHLYRSMIGSLIYLTASRPDIMFVVCACSKFQVTLKTSYLNVVKRIFRRLISRQYKKQTIVATSTIETKYVAAANCCGKNLIFHSKTKHIEIRHHLIRDAYEKKLIQVLKIHIDDNVADLLTKAFDVSKKGVKFSGKVTQLFDSMLVLHQAPEGEGSEQPTEPQPTPSPTQPSTGDQPPVTGSSSSYDTTQNFRDSLEGTNRSEGDQVQPSHDSNLSSGPTSDKAKGDMTLEELYVLCTNLSNRVLALEASKDAQDAKIIKLKTSIKKLKKKSHPESISKHGRKNAKPRPTLDNSTFGDLDADHGMDYMDTEEPMNKGRLSKETEKLNVTHDTKVLEKGGSNEEPVFKESDRPKRSILTLKPLPSIDPKDKGKGVLKESPVKKVKRSDLDAAQIAKDAEVARLMDASEELAARLQMEEREMYTVKERSRLLAEYIENRKKQLAVERSAAIRNKPPTRTQLRILMMTYLKHTDRYKHAQLNKKTLEEIQALYIKEQERAADFVLEEPDSTKVEVKQEGNTESTRKRPGRRLKIKATKKSKRQKTDSDLEEEEQLKYFLMIVPDAE